MAKRAGGPTNDQRSTTNDQQPSVLIVSNGHGEDAVGAKLAAILQSRAAVTGYPLVGTGGSYDGIPRLQPLRGLPSGGFGARGRGFIADVRAGALDLWRSQRRTLRAQRGRADLTVAVGDTFCLWMAAAAGGPVMCIATAKSSRHDPHGWLDVRIMRRVAARVFARDEQTAHDLRTRGINAVCAGNPLMDTIGGGTGAGLRRPDRHVVVLLPGSREDAYANLTDLLRLAAVVAQQAPVAVACAIAPGLDRRRVTSEVNEAGWTTDHDDVVRRGEARVMLTADFGGAIRDADVVVALAGTASEQAAGIGKPVVAFPGSGSQVTPRFLAAQQRLLGDALVSTATWTEAAAAVLRLLRAPEERLQRGSAGRLRMGPPGAIDRIAGEILRHLTLAAG
ncbi:MAG TPA: lipid-A-disaccharide synthase-related protein [bacterium]